MGPVRKFPERSDFPMDCAAHVSPPRLWSGATPTLSPEESSGGREAPPIPEQSDRRRLLPKEISDFSGFGVV